MEKVNKVTHVIWSLQQGGAEKILLDIVDQTPLDIVLVISSKIDFESSRKNIFFLKGNYLKKLSQILKISKNSGVVFWMYKSICYSFPILFLRKSCGSIHHDLEYLSREKISTKISIVLTLLLHRLARFHIVYVSEASRNNHIKYGFSKLNCSVIPNGSAVVQEKIYLESKKQLLYISRWDKIKNFNLAIDICKKLLDDKIIDKVVFVGKNVDNSNNELLSLLDRYKLKDGISLDGFQKDLEFYYNSSTTFYSISIDHQSF
jgi:glycosyltransferase involved in cell wall biosynthesis